jgi:UDP-GlcNAc:undecaprenyl-phosphate GlcNAc-1-phosphate transferase
LFTSRSSRFGALGLIDDLFGDRSVGGLKGHFSELLLNHKLTTGAAKAIGGTFSALVAGFLLNPHTPAKALVAAGIIALTANALNLTDTRPGRTILLSLLLIVLSAAIGFSRVTSIDVALFGAPVLLLCVMFLFDRSAKLMMGDVGANSIGALIGAIWVMIVPEQAQLVYFGLLIWFHIWTETHSLSQTIEKTPWLRSIDRLVGVRVGTRID